MLPFKLLNLTGDVCPSPSGSSRPKGQAPEEIDHAIGTEEASHLRLLSTSIPALTAAARSRIPLRAPITHRNGRSGERFAAHSKPAQPFQRTARIVRVVVIVIASTVV